MLLVTVTQYAPKFEIPVELAGSGLPIEWLVVSKTRNELTLLKFQILSTNNSK